jgi:hypothetical protein
LEYLVTLHPGLYRGKVKGDASAAALRAVELANRLGEARIKFPHCGTGDRVILIVRAGYNVDYVQQWILDEASVMPGVYTEVYVNVSA